MCQTSLFLLTTLLVVVYSVEIEYRQSVDPYFNRRFLSLTQGQLLTGADRQQLILPQLTKKDVVRCFDALSIKRNGRRIHLAFLGDSIVRQYFLSFLRLIPDYDRDVKSQSTLAAEYYFHEDRNVTSRLLNHLLVSFYWRNLIKQDLLDDLRHWASTTEAPDYIVLGVTSHHVDYNNVTNTMEMYEDLFRKKLVPLIKDILNTHPDLEMIWLRQSSTTDYIGPSGDRLKHGIDSEKIFKYNQVVDRLLQGTRVIMWDSINAITEEYLRACGMNRILLRQDPYKYWNCKDFIHPGFGTISIGSQLFINHICSPVDDDLIAKSMTNISLV